MIGPIQTSFLSHQIINDVSVGFASPLTDRNRVPLRPHSGLDKCGELKVNIMVEKASTPRGAVKSRCQDWYH